MHNIRDFIDLPDEQMFLPQCHWVADKKGELMTNFICNFETLHEDCKEVAQVIDKSSLELSHRNKSSHRHYSGYYDRETRAIVERVYEEDIRIFGYEF